MLDIIDTHQHLWNLNRLKLKWIDGTPELNRSYRFTDYLRAAENSGLTRTVYMEFDAHPDDKQKEIDVMTLHCLADSDEMLGMVVSADPEKPEFTKLLDINSNNSNDSVSVLSDIVTKILRLKPVVQRIYFKTGLYICCLGTDYNYWRAS